MRDEVIKTRLLLPQLAGFYGSVAPYSYAFMRFCTGMVLLPHGIQKIFSAARPRRPRRRWVGSAQICPSPPPVQPAASSCSDDRDVGAFLPVAVIGLWAGTVYEPTAIVFLARKACMSLLGAAKMASYGTGLLSIGTMFGCIAAPWLSEGFGRRCCLAGYSIGRTVPPDG